MIVAANSSSTLITTFTLGATDTASSPVELVHNVPPAAYNTTSASTLVSAGYFLYLGGTRLEIFNNSAESLQPLHSIILSDCESPRRLSLGRGVFGSSLVHIVEAIGLVECKTRVYALFPDRHSDFRLQNRFGWRLDVSTDTKASMLYCLQTVPAMLALVSVDTSRRQPEITVTIRKQLNTGLATRLDQSLRRCEPSCCRILLSQERAAADSRNLTV